LRASQISYLFLNNSYRKVQKSGEKLSPTQYQRGRVKAAVYHPKELYSPKQEKTDLEFRKTNPFNGTKYYNVLATLSMGRRSSVEQVLEKSKEAYSSLVQTLRMQNDPDFLKTQSLPKLPKDRRVPLVIKAPIDKNVAKRAGNDTHSKITNGGYSRTSYGGFFQH